MDGTDPRFNLIYEMFLPSNLLLLLLWSPSFQYLKGSELYSDTQSLTQTSSNSVSDVHLLYGAKDDGSLNEIGIVSDSTKNDIETDPSTREVSPVSYISSIITTEPGLSLIFNEHDSRPERESRIRKRLRGIFQLQFPRTKYSLRHLYIENWPEDVNLYKEHWSKEELDKINERMHLYKFHARDTPMTLNRQLNLHKMKCLTEADLDTSIRYDAVMQMVKKRFKIESGLPEAVRVDWRLLDRSRLPEKYHQVPLSSFSIKSSLILFNREIIENIHFRPVSEHDVLRRNPCFPVDVEVDKNEGGNISDDDSIQIEQKEPKLTGKKTSRQMSNIIKLDLRVLFRKQHPLGWFNMSHYEILNWPKELINGKINGIIMKLHRLRKGWNISDS